MDQETQVQTNESTNEETNVTEAPAAADESVETQTTAEDQPASTEQSVDQSDESAGEEDEPKLYRAPEFQQPQIDFSKLPMDAEGNVDPNAFAAALSDMQNKTLEQARAIAREEYAQARYENDLWSKAEKQYPQIAQNPELRELVQSTRYGLIATGKNATPAQAAAKIFKHIQQAGQAGAAASKQSVTVQRSAQLETSSVRSSTTSNSAKLAEIATSGGKREAEAARLALFEQWGREGKL